MYTALVIIDVLLAAALVALILLQHGKGADAGAAFGSGSSGTVFGAGGGASLMQKITTWIAAAFFIVTLALSYVAKERVDATTVQTKPTSVVEQIVPVESDTPLKPAAQKKGVDAIPSGTGAADTIAPAMMNEEVPLFKAPANTSSDSIPVPEE